MFDNIERKDLRSLVNKDSLLRKIFKESGDINLRSVSIPKFSYGDYVRDKIYLPVNENGEALIPIRDKILTPYYDIIEKYTNPRFKNSLSELVRNAQKHGNGSNPDYAVGIGYTIKNKFDGDYLSFYVEDYGLKPLDADFLIYSIYVNELVNNGGSNFESFYDYLGDYKEKPKGNSGVGTIVIHSSSDRVNYFKSDLGGLLVEVEKRLE